MNIPRFSVIVLFSLLSARGSDWPHLLGPTSDAVYSGPALAEEWPDAGPPVVWKIDAGEGYSSPVIAEGRLIFCHRLEDQLIVDSLDPKTGGSFWRFKHEMKFQDGAYFDSGPRPTPSIKDGKVYIHNSDGYLASLDLKDGREIWSLNTKAKFNSSATWHGCVASPCVNDLAVILPVGGTDGCGVVAFDRATGETLWQTTDEKATASTPVMANFGGRSQLLVVTRTALHSLDPVTGKDLWSQPTRRQTSGNVYAANPVVFGDLIFLSGWYKLGAQLIRVKDHEAETLWHLDDAISTHYAAGIIYQDHIYGFHGHAWERGGPNLRCIELATGKLVWEQPQVGSGTIARFQDNLLILSDTGELQLAKASPKGFQSKGRFQAVGRTTRTYPALADGFAYIKGPRQLICVDLRAGAEKR